MSRFMQFGGIKHPYGLDWETGMLPITPTTPASPIDPMFTASGAYDPTAPAAPPPAPRVERAPASIEQATLDQIDQSVRNAKLRGAGSPFPPAQYTYGMSAPAVDPVAATRAVTESAFSAYNPAGVGTQRPGASSVGSVATGNPFLDQNTDFNKLAGEKAIKDQNDASFTAGNNARLAEIAAQREGVERKRRDDLAASGLTPEQIDMRMNPHKYRAPVDPAVALAQKTDLAERQGRGAMHAIAQKLIRGGLPPALAYSIAMNTIGTTNPADQGAKPSLPGMDQGRVALVNPAGGEAIGRRDVGMEQADVGREVGLARADSDRDVGMAQAQGGLFQSIMDFITKSRQQDTNDKVVGSEIGNPQSKAALAYLQSQPNLQFENPQLYATLIKQAFPQQTVQPGNQGVTPTAPTAPAAPAAVTPQQVEASTRGLSGEDQELARAKAWIAAGQPNNPAVESFVRRQLDLEPNLYPWTHDGLTSAFYKATGFGSGRHERAGELIEQKFGIPRAIASEIARRYYGGM